VKCVLIVDGYPLQDDVVCPWEGREMHAEFYKENPKAKELVEYINIGGRMTLKWFLKK
jgi:hypothetical protein